jgi:hypothetical protein
MRILLDAIMKHISNFEVKPNRFCALKVGRFSYFGV